MGERRWRASSKAGLATIPAIVRDTKDDIAEAIVVSVKRLYLLDEDTALAYRVIDPRLKEKR